MADSLQTSFYGQGSMVLRGPQGERGEQGPQGIPGLPGPPAIWGTIPGILADQADLKAALDAKSNEGHTHTIANVSGLQAALDGKAATSHTHTVANVSGLQAALDGKAATSHTHSYLPLSGGTLTGDLNGQKATVTAAISFYDSDAPSNSAGIVAGRSATQYISIRGGPASNYIDSISPAANPKRFQIRVSTDDGATYKTLNLGPDLQWDGAAFLINNALLSQHDGSHGYFRTQSGKGNLYLGANGTNHVTIATGGSVGIGAVPGTHKLTVGGDVRIADGGDLRLSSAFVPGDTTKDSQIFNDNADMRFLVNGAVRGMFEAGGALLLGTATGTDVIGSGSLRVKAAGDDFAVCASTAKPEGMYAFQVVVNGGHVGGISATGTATAYNTTSDQTLKDDDGALTSSQAWAILNLVQVHEYRWKLNGSEDIGVFAQELYAVYPSAVTRGGWRDPETGTWSDTAIEGVMYQPWSVDYSKLIPLLTVALQDVHTRLANVEGAVA